MKKDFNNILDLIQIVPYHDVKLEELINDDKLVDTEDKIMAKWVGEFGRKRYLTFYNNSCDYLKTVYGDVGDNIKYKFLDSQFHNYKAITEYFKKEKKE